MADCRELPEILMLIVEIVRMALVAILLYPGH